MGAGRHAVVTAKNAPITSRSPNRHELLHALAGVDFGRIEVAEAVGGDVVHPLELSGLPAAAPERTHSLECLALEDPDLLVGTVRDEEPALLGVARSRTLFTVSS